MSAIAEAPSTGQPGKRQRLSEPESRERSSRASYVPKACQPCRRRKTRCNGQLPCNRCGADGPACFYDPSSRRRYPERSKELSQVTLQLSKLRDQVRELSSRALPLDNVNHEKVSAQEGQTVIPPLPIPASVGTLSMSCEASDKLTTFRGPTSFEFSLGLATGNLQSNLTVRGEQSLYDVNGLDIAVAAGSEVLVEQIAAAKILLDDPLQDMHLAEAKRLIHVYQNGSGANNPILNTEELLNVCERVFRLLEEARTTRCVKSLISATEQLNSSETTALKLVLANGSILDSSGIDRRARVIFESVRKQLANAFWALPNLQMIQNWILVAILHYNLDEELQASRVTAHAARLCLELGINRTTVLQRSFKNACDRAFAKKLVCNTFILDRRSSIGIGLPPAIPVKEMDVSITTTDDESLYLQSLVKLACIFEDVFQITNQLSDKAFPVPTMEIDYLEFQVLQWQNGLPDSFSVSRDDWRQSHHESLNTAQLFRKFVLVLRANHIRSLIYRPILYTKERIIAHGNHARTAIRVAREAIQLLTDLSIYHADMLNKNILLFKYFLISAFSALLLAVANFPNAIPSQDKSGLPHSSDSVQKEFYMAIDLFKLFSSRSPVMATLWKAVQNLQRLTVQAGLPPVSRQSDTSDTNNTSHPDHYPNGAEVEVHEQYQQDTLPWPVEQNNNDANASDSIAQLTSWISPLYRADNGSLAIEPYEPVLDFFSLDPNLYTGF